MSQTVDNRVVEMQFDNAEFERGISTSIASLERLKESLNFEGAVKGFDSLANFNTSGKDAFDGLAEGANKVQSSFSAMQVVGYTAISEITKGVMGLAGKLLGFISGPLAQIEAGGKRRALNIEQARFQMQGLGLDVEEAMRNSLDAVDGTAYGLDVAAKAAGQLAASGVKLGTDMTTTLRGIAGVASMTSSSFEDISPIFTTVAGQGRLMTMQLRQLESRGINAAATMAKAFGTTEAAVREMVTDGEVSFEMFSKAMSDAFGDQATKANDTYSGSLMNVQAALSRIGAKFYAPYYENMRQTLNGLRLVINAINAGLDPLFQMTERIMILARTLSLSNLQKLDFSGMADGLMRLLIPAINIAVNVGTALSNVFGTISKAWAKVFPKASVLPFVSLLTHIADITTNIGLGEKNLSRLTDAFSGLFSLLKGVGVGAILLLKVFWSVLTKIGESVEFITTPLFAFAGILGKFISDVVFLISNGVGPMDAFSFVIKNLGDKLSSVSKTLDSSGKIIRSALDGIGKAVLFVTDVLKNMDWDFRPLTVFADEANSTLGPLANQNGNLFTRVADGLRNGLTKMKEAFSVVDSNFSNFIQTVGEGLAKAFDTLGSAVKAVQPVLEAGGRVISYFFNLIKDAFDGVTAIDILNTGFFAALVIVIRNFLKPIKDFSSGVVDLMDAARGALESYQNKLMPNILLAIGAAVLMLAGAFFIMAQVPKEKIVTTLAAISALLIELTGAMLLLSHKVGDKAILKLSISMMALSTAVLILAHAVEVLGGMDAKEALVGVLGISVLVWELVAISVVLKRANADMIKGSTSLLFFSSSLYIMAYAVKNLGGMDLETLKTGLLAIGSLIVMLGIFMKTTEKSMTQMPAFAAGLLLMAAALNLLVLPLLLLGKIPWPILIKGLTVVTAVLTIVAFAANAMQSIAPQMVKLGAGLLLLAVALNLLVAPLLILSTIPIQILGRGLALLTVMLSILALSALAMGPIQGQLLAVAAGLTMLAIAVNLLLIPMLVLGALPINNILVGLTALAGLFLVLGVSAMALAPLSGGLIVVAAALALIGLAANLAGVGLVLLASGISALGLSLAGVATVLPVFLKAMESLIQQIIRSLEVVVISIVNSLGRILAGVIKALIQIIIDSSPKLFELLGVLLNGILNLIAKYTPKLITIVLNLIMTLMHGIEARSKDFTKTALGIIENLLKGLAEGIPGVAEAGADVVIAFLDAIGKQTQRIVDAAFKMAITLINGLNDTLEERGPELATAMSKLAGTMLETFVDVLFAPAKGIFSTGQNVVLGLVDGIKDKLGDLKDAATSAGAWLLDALNGELGVSSPAKRTFETGQFVDQGLANGVTSSNASANAVTAKGSDLLILFKQTLDKISPLSEKAGEESGKGLAEGIAASTPKAVAAARKSAEEIAKEEADARQKSYNASKEWIDNEKYYERLALADELAAWQRVQAKFLEGTEERKQADKEVYRAAKAIDEATESYEQKRADIRTQRNEARKELEDDYYAKVKETNAKLEANIAELNKTYSDSVKERADTLYGSFGLFDAVTASDAVSGETLITNLQGQIDAFDSWQKNIASLAQKGISDGLLKELEAMGPSAAMQIDALNQMTAEQLTTYATMWQTKHSQVTTEATWELESLRVETAAKIVELKATAETELEGYKLTWKRALKTVNSDAKEQLAALKTEFATSMYGLRVGAESQLVILGSNAKTILNNARPGIEGTVSVMAANMQAIVQNGNWVGVGENVVNGMIKGINNKTNALMAAVRAMAAAAEAAGKKQLDINSPSGVFESMGEFTVLGFVKGINSLGSMVASAANGIGASAMAGINSAISSIVDAVEADPEFSPVITPILDLDSIQNGMRSISDILNQENVIASTIATDKKSQGINSEKQNSTDQNPNVTYEFVQNNYSPKALSRLDIYRQTKNQLSAVKGLVKT